MSNPSDLDPISISSSIVASSTSTTHLSLCSTSLQPNPSLAARVEGVGSDSEALSSSSLPLLSSSCASSVSSPSYSSPSSTSAASSSASSSSSAGSSSSSPPAVKYQLHITAPEEIDRLAKQWKKPIPACDQIRQAGVAKILLTNKTFQHVFGLTVTADNRKDGASFGSWISSGFHHFGNFDDAQAIDLMVNASLSLSSIGLYANQGTISFKHNELPKFKTMFKQDLTREQIVNATLESLNNVTSVKKIDGKLAVHGVSASFENLTIITVLTIPSGRVVTFYPKPTLTRDEIEQSTKQAGIVYEKHFGNPQKLPVRSPLTQEELNSLLANHSDMQISNWKLAYADPCTPDYYAFLFSISGRSDVPPDLTLTILDDAFCERLQREQHMLLVEHDIPPLKIPMATLQKAFGNDAVWPIYLQRSQILKLLKKTLQRFMTDFNDELQCFGSISFPKATQEYKPAEDDQDFYDEDYFEDYDEDEEEEEEEEEEAKSGEEESAAAGAGSEADEASSSSATDEEEEEEPRHSLTTTVPLPHFMKEADECFSFSVRSRGGSVKDRWKFRVKLNPKTGDIVDFYPLVG